jgi:hypothetical protein
MPSGGYTGSTYNDIIERTYRRLMSNTRESICTLDAGILYGDTTFTVDGLGAVGCHAGGLVAIGTEVLLIEDAQINVPSKQAVLTVQRGYQGSTPTEYAAGQVAYVDPRFTRWDIAIAINDALGYLSSPTYGLFQVVTNTITYNPVVRGYDLGAWPQNLLRTVGVVFDVPDASHYFPRLRGARIQRGIVSSKIPSGNGLFLTTDGAWPGLNMSISIACPFTPLINLNDDVEVVSGLDSGAIDILPLCAAIDLGIVQEIKRGELGSQTDPQKLQNVPPAATTNAIMALKILRDERVAQEAGRLALRWPEIPPGY